MSGRRPPRVARWLLKRFVPKDVRDEVSGDLEEVFHRRVRVGGARGADAWYWLQSLSFSLRFAFEAASERMGALRSGLLPSWLDLKLGTRMLVKSPLLTVTGCVAIATAIGINAGFHEFMRDMHTVVIQLESDDRIVGLANYDIESGERDPRLLEDMGRWREGLETVEHIGAALRLDLSLIGPDGGAVPVDVAEMSASGFQVTSMVPVLGRPLLQADDGPGAEPVAVVGYDTWQRYLGGDPNVVGATIRLGDTSYRIVGVAPADFRFPTAVDDLWINFRRDPDAYPPRAGPPLMVFGRLAPGRRMSEARAEVEQLGQRIAADRPETHARLRPAVAPLAEMVGFSSDQLQWGIRIARTMLVMLLIVACANIATLVFARNAGRTSEIAVRTALGAGRARIVSQLFAEAMVLATISAAVGLFVADRGLRYGGQIFWEAQRMEPPFWWDPGVSMSTVLYSLALATLGAGVVGILPALRATGRGLTATLQRAGSGGGTLSFGRLPMAVIVVQTAIAVALFPIVLTGAIADFRDQFVAVAFPTEGYLTARILVDSNVQLTATASDHAEGVETRTIQVAGVTDRFVVGPSLLSRYAEMREDVARRVRSEPGVRRVALTSRLPGLLGQSIPAARLEVNGQPPRDQGWYTRTSTAELDLFEVVGREMVAGRPFTNVDYGPDERVAIVNQAFVREILGGEAAVGRLVRDFDPNGDPGRPWTEIVGVLPDELVGPSASAPQVYYPLQGAGEYPIRMLIEVDGDPASLAPRLQAIAATAEPGIIVDEIFPLEALRRNEVMQLLFRFGVLGFVALVTALLATAGVYALMSFIVSQRTREIGIRTALGANPALVLRGIFMRTFVQLGLGVVLGLVIVGVVGPPSLGGTSQTLWYSGAAVSVVIVVVGLVGCLVPVRRALRIQPTEALRADG